MWIFRSNVIYETERGDGTRQDAETPVHTLRRSERKFPLVKFVLKAVDIQILVALEHHEIMPVALMIPEKQILAMHGIYVLPIFQRLLYRRKRRMLMQLVTYGMLFQKGKHPVYSGVACHFALLLA